MIRKKLVLLIERGVEEGVEPPLQDFIAFWNGLEEVGRSKVEKALWLALNDYADEIGENDPGTESLEEAVQYFTITATFCCATGVSALVKSFRRALRRVLTSSDERSLDVRITDPMRLVPHYTHREL